MTLIKSQWTRCFFSPKIRARHAQSLDWLPPVFWSSGFSENFQPVFLCFSLARRACVMCAFVFWPQRTCELCFVFSCLWGTSRVRSRTLYMYICWEHLRPASGRGAGTKKGKGGRTRATRPARVGPVARGRTAYGSRASRRTGDAGGRPRSCIELTIVPIDHYMFRCRNAFGTEI